MGAILKYASLLSLILLNTLYLHDFVRISPSKPFWLKVVFGIHLVFSSALVFYLFQFHTTAFLFKISDFLLLIAWGIALVFWAFELIFPSRSLGALVLPVPLVLSFVGIYSLNLSHQIPEEYTGYLFLLHVAFSLAGYICAFFLFLISLVYSLSLSWFKKKKVNRLTKKMPPLALQQNQINVFLILALIFLVLGLFFGSIWMYELGTFSGEILFKTAISSLATLTFALLLIVRNRYGISFRGNIFLVSLGCLFLVISLIVGKHGI